LSLSRDDPGHVLLEFIVVLALNQIMSPLNGENDMDVNLCVGVGHNMPLLRSFRDFDTDNYKDHAPTEHAPGIWPCENLAAALKHIGIDVQDIELHTKGGALNLESGDLRGTARLRKSKILYG
jgi:hypothetical protein